MSRFAAGHALLGELQRCAVTGVLIEAALRRVSGLITSPAHRVEQYREHQTSCDPGAVRAALSA